MKKTLTRAIIQKHEHIDLESLHVNRCFRDNSHKTDDVFYIYLFKQKFCSGYKRYKSPVSLSKSGKERIRGNET